MITLIAQHMPFVFLTTATICVFLYIILKLDEIPEKEKTKHWINRHPKHSAIGAMVIFIVISLIVLTLATDIL